MRAFAPNGCEIFATADVILGNALINGDSFRRDENGDLQFNYAGNTDMRWDEQVNVDPADPVYIDENGNEWREYQLRLVEDDETAEALPEKDWPKRKTVVTAIIRDNAPGYNEPLIYEVKVEEVTIDAVMAEVYRERRRDLEVDEDGSEDHKVAGVDLSLMFVINGKIETVLDARQGGDWTLTV